MEGLAIQNFILTSTGFDNKKIQEKFLELVGMPSEKIKAIFIPTAAITEEQKSVVPLCKNDLLNAGVLEKNIITYDLDRIIDSYEICKFNVLYVCGGSTQHLLDKMNENKFYVSLKAFLENGGVYVGVSAGSIVLANNLPNNLGYINCKLHVHTTEGTKLGYVDTSESSEIKLTNKQAIIITDNDISIIE